MADTNSIHETLMGQLPDWFKPVLEYIAIMRAGAVELGDIEGLAEQIRANTHIQTADEATIRYWERFLGLSITAGDTLEYRRERIMLRINQRVPYTLYDLSDELQRLFGSDYSLSINERECWIRITVTSDRYGAIPLLHELIYNRIPAHLYVYSNQRVNNNVTTTMHKALRLSRTFEQVIGLEGSNG